ncbi:MAG: Ig-like domain-containing protein [Mobilitalea sp.]
MRNTFYKRIAVLLAFVLILPLLFNQNTAVVTAATATPSLVQTKVEIIGTGETYQLEIKDKIAKSTYKWTSSSTKIAKVNSSGLVTSVNKGTATIKCVVTYPSKKTKTLSCKVTVTIPAESIEITNDVLVNGAHVLSLGSTMKFNTSLLPKNSSDKVYWSVEGGDAACIRIDNVSDGSITALKAGKVILRASAAKSATAQAAELSIINDAVIVEVVGPTATVKSVEMISSKEIRVLFDSAVNANTIIGSNSTLTDNIEITLSKDIKGVLAADPGKLTASLSTDGKTLTINTQNSLNGSYGINFTSDILTTTGVALESYYKKISYQDTTPPTYAGYTIDDSGLVVTINFSEPLDFSNLKISGATQVSSSTTAATATTLSVLNNVMNYKISEDKKSLVIDLTKISAADYSKYFSIVISGVTDLAGNAPANAYIQAYLQTDTSPKPQAKFVGIERTSYNIITVTFDRAISFGGYLQVEGGLTITGVPDATNTKRVNYTISDAEAAVYTGVKKVSIGFWKSYNVIASDTSADKMTTYNLDLTIEKTSPILLTYDYDSTSAILTLTYSEPVVINASSGIFSSIYSSINEDVKPNTNITYSNLAHSDGNKVIKLQLTGSSMIGTYQFDLVAGFVTDNFRNKSITKNLLINNTGTGSSVQPGPYEIVQSTTSSNDIYVRFLNKLDTVSALNINNYKIAGLTITKVTLQENTTSGATVVLTVADGTITQSIDYPVTITGVKGFNNSNTAIELYKSSVALKENIRPTFVGGTFDSVSKNVVRLNFSESIQGTLVVKATVTYSSYSYEIPATVSFSGTYALVTLSSIPTTGSRIQIDILSSNLTDLSGNALTSMPTPINVAASY